MSDIVWLASYPKSGNTWVRVLLANYARNAAEPESINALGAHVPGASSRMLFDAHCALKSTALSNEIVTRLRPQIVRRLAGAASGQRILKVHDAWQRTDRGEALFPQDCTAGTIYIIRNVLDVAASLANHSGMDIPSIIEKLCDRSSALARGRGGPQPQVQQFLGDWSYHVTSWIDESNLNCLLVRYEDLQANAVSVLREIVPLAGLEVDEGRLMRAVAHSRFDVLKDMEHSQGFYERSSAAPYGFFRKGKAGGWREELSPDLVRRLVDAHGDVMRRFGYLDQDGQPV